MEENETVDAPEPSARPEGEVSKTGAGPVAENDENDAEVPSDEEQVAVVEETDNSLSEEDAANIPQPPQDADWKPDDVEEE